MFTRGHSVSQNDEISITSASSYPPQKPPRGLLRRTPVRVEPLKDVANEESHHQTSISPTPSQSKFSTTEKYQNMKNHFRRQVGLRRENGEFSGHEAVDILDEYLHANREQFPGRLVKRENAVKVLDMWLHENVISPIQAISKDCLPVFQDNKKSMYVMNPDEDHRLYVCASPVVNSARELGRRASRSSSFKRFFSPGRSKCSGGTVRDALIRSHSAISDVSETSSRRFNASAAKRSQENRPLAEEAHLHDAALFRLLTIVEIPMLDGITSTHGHESKSVSILSAILSKMGLGTVLPSALLFKDEEEMDDLLQNTPAIRPVLPWFQMARICAPSLLLKPQGKVTKTEIHNWAKQALQAVSDRYSSITRHGSSPLIPVEFKTVLHAITDQLLGKNRKRTKLALQYLCLMIPRQLRTHLVNLVHFLLRTVGTDEYMSIRSPFYLGKRGDNENFEVVLNELRPFIFPQKEIEIADQNSIVEVFMQLQKEGILGREPPELIADLKNMKICADKTVVPVRFCEAESASKGFDPEAEIACALRAIIDDARIPLAEKQKKCELFKQHHPKMYRKYFAHLSW